MWFRPMVLLASSCQVWRSFSRLGVGFSSLAVRVLDVVLF
jgi:hypothetical protein